MVEFFLLHRLWSNFIKFRKSVLKKITMEILGARKGRPVMGVTIRVSDNEAEVKP